MTQAKAPTAIAQLETVKALPTPLPTVSEEVSGIVKCFLSTFITIFLAELGDKTQVATLLMSAQSHQPWVVFAGAASALVATSLVGVLIGRWLCQVLSPRTLEKATGVILAIVSLLLFCDVAGH